MRPAKDWSELERRVPGLSVSQAGGSVPFQSEGTLCGYSYYFRYRGGGVSLAVGATDSTPTVWSGALWSATTSYGDEWGGSLSQVEFEALMVELVPQLTRAPFLWQFSGRKVKLEDTALGVTMTRTYHEEIYRSLAHTADEAYERLHSLDPVLESHGWTPKRQKAYFALREIHPVPLNEDTRVFPHPEPTFSVVA